MKKDDLIAKAINLGLGKDQDLVSLNKSQLEEMIIAHNAEVVKKEINKTKKIQKPPKHNFFRG